MRSVPRQVELLNEEVQSLIAKLEETLASQWLKQLTSM